MVSKQKSLGQYPTPEPIVRLMVNMISKDRGASILEPSAGTGNFLKILDERKYTNIDAYELDKSLKNESKIGIIYDDFLSLKENKKYDVIIGNPPYARWKNIPKEIQKQLLANENLKHRLNGLMDILHAFILKCLDHLNDNGELIFITPTYWTETLHASNIRKEMLEKGFLEHVILLDEAKVFDGVSSSIMIFKFVKNEKARKAINVIKLPQTKKIDENIIDQIQFCLDNLKRDVVSKEGIISFKQPQFSTSDFWRLNEDHVIKRINQIKEACKQNVPEVEINLENKKINLPISELLRKEDLEELNISKSQCFKINVFNSVFFLKRDFNKDKKMKLSKRHVQLGDIARIGNGMVSGLDKAFQASPHLEFSKDEKKQFISVIKAHSLEKFRVNDSTDYIFVEGVHTENELKKFKNIHRQLSQYKNDLEKRYNYDRHINWWEWVFLRNRELLEKNKEKIFVPCKERINKKEFVRFAYVNGDYYATQDVTTIVKRSNFREDIKYILAILNSEVIFFWIKHQGLSRGGVVEFSERPLSKIPIRMINWSSPKEVKIYKEIVELVNEILRGQSSKKITSGLDNKIKYLYDFE